MVKTDRLLDYLDLSRADGKALRCKAGNKQCGDRCVPQASVCASEKKGLSTGAEVGIGLGVLAAGGAGLGVYAASKNLQKIKKQQESFNQEDATLAADLEFRKMEIESQKMPSGQKKYKNSVKPFKRKKKTDSQLFDYADLRRTDNKTLRCKAGNKQCGDRCVPKQNKCKEEKESYPGQNKAKRQYVDGLVQSGSHPSDAKGFVDDVFNEQEYASRRYQKHLKDGGTPESFDWKNLKYAYEGTVARKYYGQYSTPDDEYGGFDHATYKRYRESRKGGKPKGETWDYEWGKVPEKHR